MAAPTPYLELPAATFDPVANPSDWLEITDNTQPGGVAQLSNGQQEAVLSGYVPWEKQRSAARWFLGFAYGDTASPWRLHRELPACHPVYPWLYAHSISFVGYVPKANTANANNSPYVPALFPAQPKIVPRVAYYEKVIATVRFRDFGGMKFLTDAEIGESAAVNESQRYVTFHPVPAIQELTATGGSRSFLKFAEGSGVSPQPTGGTTPFDGGVLELLAKTKFIMTWHQVPHDYLSADPDLLNPTKILACVGKVNTAAFLGFAAGTLLMHPPEFRQWRYPVPVAAPTDTLTFWDVTVPLELFDPDKGVVGSAYRGHNLMPWYQDGKWYLATRDGTAGGNRLYPTADFDTMFEHVLEP